MPEDLTFIKVDIDINNAEKYIEKNTYNDFIGILDDTLIMAKQKLLKQIKARNEARDEAAREKKKKDEAAREKRKKKEKDK